MSLTLEQELLFNYLKIVSVSLYEETDKVYNEILSSSGCPSTSQNQLGYALSSINDVIKKFDLEIVEAVDDVSSKKIHCLISTNNNSAARKASFYDKVTCEFLSKIIQECVTSESGSMSGISCLNMNLATKTNKSSLQASLERLVKDKWVVYQNGNVTLGIRSQLELELSIKKQYPTFVKYCSLCKTFMMQGTTCPECNSNIHYHCLVKFNEMNGLSPNSKTCPICKEGGSQESSTEDVDMDDDGGELTDGDIPAKRFRKSRGD